MNTPTNLNPKTPLSPECPPKKISSRKRREQEKKASQTGWDSVSKSLSKVPNGKERDPRKVEALRRIKVTPDQLASAPNITDILKETKGGITLALRAMRFSSSELIISFLEKYDSVPERDREELSIEAIALSAGINIQHLWGEMMLAIREHSVSSVKVIALAAHPEVIAKRVEYAKTPGGYRDRDALDTMLGALPKPGGATFIDKIFVTRPNAEKQASDEEEEEQQVEATVDDLDYIFPDASEVQEQVQKIKQKMLPSGE